MSYANCFSDVLRSHYNTDLQLFIDLRTGGYQDLSANARVVTYTAGSSPAQWQTRTRGKGTDIGGVLGNSGRFSVPTAVALNLQPSGTIVCLLRTERGYAGAGVRYAYKRNAGGGTCAYDLYDNTGAGAITLYDGAAAHALGTVSLPSTRSITVAFTVGSPPRGYGNGVPLAPPATLWAPVGADVAAVDLPGGSGTGFPGVGWWGWLLFSAQLTGAEIAQLYTDFEESAFAL